MKPSWWDRDFSNDLKAVWSWLSIVFEGRIAAAFKKDWKLSFKQFETNDEWVAARAAASKAEWLRLDAIQREFERKGSKKLTQAEVKYILTSLEQAQAETQRLAQEQRKWGKMYLGDGTNES
jgi:hypothetical protein